MMSDSQEKEFLTDLRKLQDEYNYDSRGCGSINILDVDDDGKCVAAVNWSCCGDQTPKYARPFAEALIAAIDACERFNTTHDLDSH